MKTIRIIGALIIISILLTSAFAFIQEEDKGKAKEKQEQKDKDKAKAKGNQGKGNAGKGNEGKGNEGHHDHEKGTHKPDKTGNGNNGQPNSENDKDHSKGHKGKSDRDDDDRDNDKKDRKDIWDKSFRDRSEGNAKITICHKPSANPELPVTITVSERAWKAHAAHGDVMGACPAPTTRLLDDDIAERRIALYHKVADVEDLLFYSEDVLAAARERVRLALINLEAARKARVPQTEIVVRQERITKAEALINTVADLLQITRRDVDVNVDLVEVDLVSR